MAEDGKTEQQEQRGQMLLGVAIVAAGLVSIAIGLAVLLQVGCLWMR